MEHPAPNQPVRKRHLSFLSTPLAFIVLAACLALTFLLWRVAEDNIESQSEAAFNRDAANIELAIINRMSVYTNALYGLQGLFGASETVSRSEFKDYVNTVQIDSRYPGISSLSFLEIVDENEKEQFIEEFRNDTSTNPAGYPDFKITPEASKSSYVVFKYIEPEASTSAFGFDYTSDPARKDAVDRARTTDSPNATAIVRSVTTKQPAFVILLPAYGRVSSASAALDQPNLLGYVAAGFRPSILFTEVFEGQNFESLNFDLYDTDNPENFNKESLIFAEKPVSELGDNPLQYFSTFEIAGRKWTLNVEAPQGYGLSGGEQNGGFIVLVTCLILSGLIFSVLYSLANSQRRALALADEMTSELRESKEELEEKEQQLRDAQEAGEVGSFIWHLDSNKTELSNEIYKLYGTSNGGGEQTIEQFFTLVHPDDRDTLMKKMSQLPYSKEPFEYEYRVVWPSDKSSHWLKARGRTLFTDGGQPYQVVGTIQDVTRDKQVDKAKSEFVSLASHQLRTPLSAINWYTEMLLAGDAGQVSEEQKKYLQEVYLSNQRMVELVNSLLNVSRLELGTFSIDPVTTNIVDLAKSVVQEVEPDVFKRKQELNEHYDEGIPEINVDPKLTRMIFQNLLTNASKYTPEEGKVDLTIKKEADYLLISVADTGYGIPKDQQDKIFGKLFRADNVRAKDTEGTGLGLYIIKSIVENTGGMIWFESEENQGTTFFVKIPLAGMRKKAGAKALG